MSDLLRRLVGRALGRAELVQPVVGTRFGQEPGLLSEMSESEEDSAPAVALPGVTGDRPALPSKAATTDEERG